MINTAKIEFEKDLRKYEEKNEDNLKELTRELKLKIKTEIHEI